METEHRSETISDLRTHSAATVGGGDPSTTGKKLSSSSSSSPSSSSYSSSEEPFQLDEYEPSKFTVGTSAPPELDKEAQLASGYGEKDLPSSSISKHKQSNHGFPGLISPSPPAVSRHSHELSLSHGSATQFPPIQVMERPGDVASYRIPSSVFARTKSTTPMEWSLASNESLFSIHTGNMSFTRDQIILMSKSGELGNSGEPSMSGQFINFSTNQPPVNKATDIGKRTANTEGLGVTEAAVETMKEVLRANEEHRSKEKSSLAEEVPHSASMSRLSDESGASIKSFAFPILTGEGEKSGSVKVGLEQQQQRHQQQESQPQPQPQPQSQPQTPAASSNASKTKWFYCFHCPFCP